MMYFHIDRPIGASTESLSRSLAEQFTHYEDDKMVSDLEWDFGSTTQGCLKIHTGHQAFDPMEVRVTILPTRICFIFDDTALAAIIQAVIGKWVGLAIEKSVKKTD